MYMSTKDVVRNCIIVFIIEQMCYDHDDITFIFEVW